MTVIERNYDALLRLVARRARGLVALQAAHMACRLADVFLRIAAINWCFIWVNSAPITVMPVGVLCSFVMAQIVLQACIASLDVITATAGKRFDDQCMDDAMRASLKPGRRRDGDTGNPADRLADYKFNVAYIGSISRNVTYIFDIAAFVCSMTVYAVSLILLLYGIIAARPVWGIAVAAAATVALVWSSSGVKASADDDESETFSDILRTERQRRYYIFDIVHRYPVHAVLDTFHAGGFITRRYRELNDRGLAENLAYMDGMARGQRRFLIQQVVLFGTMTGVLAVSVLTGSGTLRLFPMLVGISIQAMDSGMRALNDYRQIRRVSPHLGNVVAVLTTAERSGASMPAGSDAPAVSGDPTGRSDHGARDGRERPGAVGTVNRIDVEDVWFSYDGSDEYVLRGVTLHLDMDGSVSAIVGLNGAGKSTLLALMSGMLKPTRGRVLVDGVDTRDLDLDRHLDLVGVLAQECHLFSGTLRDNVMAGTVDTAAPATFTAERLLADAGAGESLTSRLDRHVASLEEDDMAISGGEARRVAMARLLAAPGRRLYLLDEPTSAFDPLACTAFFRDLRRMVRGVTTVVVTHDIESCKVADRIIVVEDGRIVQDGTFAGLADGDGRFARLLASQRDNRR